MSTLSRLLLTAASIALTAIAVAILWRWFLVPFGIPEIGAMHAMGLVATIRLVAVAPLLVKDEKEDHRAWLALLLPMWVLGMGWIAKLGM